MPLETDDIPDELGQICDTDITSPTDVDVKLVRVPLTQENKRIGEIIDVEKLPSRPPCAPNLNRIGAADLRQVRFRDQRRHNVAGHQIIGVSGPVEIGGLCRDEVATVLPPICGAQLKPS